MKHKCPVCHKIVNISVKEQSEKAKFFPFCSRRCKLVDLGAWLDAKYKIISELQSPQSSEPPDSPSSTSSDQR
ncbi:MAG: DNA gyrase inhibitor YacG [Sedimentisphaerales bacterium]